MGFPGPSAPIHIHQQHSTTTGVGYISHAHIGLRMHRAISYWGEILGKIDAFTY